MSAPFIPRWITQSVFGVLAVVALNVVFSGPPSFAEQQTYCTRGFLLVDGKCVDVDECAVENGGCGDAKCANVDGGWRCGANCPAGFTGTPATGCVDINECATGNGACDRLTLCRNTLGSRICSQCPEDHLGDGLVGCFDVNEVKNAPDKRAPGIATPGNMTVAATSAEGAVVKFAVSAIDFVDGPRPVTCAPAAGATFPAGDTAVTCTSTDAAGNKGTASFTITVVK